MPVPAFANAGAGAQGAGDGFGGSINVPHPTGIGAGDILIIQAFAWGDAETVSTPSGWSAGPSTSGTQGGHYLFLKEATGSESGDVTVTFSDTVAGAYGRMYRFTGAASSVDDTGTAEGNSTTVNDVGVTTGEGNRLAVNLIAIRDNLAVGAFSGQTGGTWAEAVAEYTSTQGNDACLQIQIAEMASAGTINGGSLTTDTATSPGTNHWSVIGFSLLGESTPFSGSVTAVEETDTAQTLTPTVTGSIELYAEIDFGDGDLSIDPALLRSADIRRGRPFNLDRVEAGTCNALFNDGEGWLDPTNTGGPHYGSIFPLTPLRILRRDDGVTFERFNGPIERFVPRWHPPSHKDMEVQAADGFETLANTLIESDRASLTTNLTGTNNDLTFTAVEGGGQGDDITVTYVVAGTNTSLETETNEPTVGSTIGFATGESPVPFAFNPSARIPSAVTLQGSDITVNVATSAGGAATSTANDIKTALEANPAVMALVSIALAPGSDGTGVVTAMAQTNLSGGKWPEELSGARISRILDLAGWDAGARDIDTGSYLIAAKGYSIKENVSAIQAIQDVADSELGYVFMTGDNVFTYHDIGHRGVDPRSTSSRATFSNVGTGNFRYQNLEQSYDKDRIINKATVTGGNPGAVPQMAEDTYSQTGTGSPPAGAPDVPPGGYGPREVSRNTLLANDTDCLAQAQSIVEAFAYPQQRIESLTTMELDSPAGWSTSVLELEIGDRITVIVKPPSWDDDASTTSYEMFVEEIADTIAPGRPWTVTLRLTPASQSVAPPTPEEDAVLNNIGGPLILDSTTDGKIG